MSEKVRFGVLHTQTKSYVCRYRDMTVLRGKYQVLEDIPQDIFWFSDLPLEKIWFTGAFLSHIIKDHMYLNLSFQELHHLFKKQAKSEQQTLLQIFGFFERLMNTAMSRYFLDGAAPSLSLAMSKALNGEVVNHDEEMQFRINRAYAESLSCINEREQDEFLKEGWHLVCLKKNGFLYLEQLLAASRVPKDDSGYEMADSRYIAALVAENRLQSYLDTLTSPYMIESKEIRARHRDDAMAKMLEKRGLKMTYHKGKHLERFWQTSTEYGYMKNLLLYQPVSVLVFKEFLNPEDLISLNPYWNHAELFYFSFVYALIAENHALALLQKPFLEDQASFRNIFLSAEDKRESMYIALACQQLGMKPARFGHNRVEVLYKDNSQLSLLKEIAGQTHYHIWENAYTGKGKDKWEKLM